MTKKIIEIKREFFKTNQTKNLNFRIKMLKTLKNNIIKYEEEIFKAIKKDLNRSDFITYTAEISPVLEEIEYFIKNIKKLSKPKCEKTPKMYIGYKSYVVKEPLGVCLVISPWNYPFLLSLSPVVGAIASGNCVILKPSEFSTNTSMVLKKIISESFTPDYCEVVLGEKEVVQSLIDNKVDFVFFTGNTNVGKSIMERASKTLTPVALELGGKSPCIIDKEIDIKKTAKRIVWGKFLNTGQTCIAPDYLLVHKDIADEFIKNLFYYTKTFWGENALENKNYPKIISENHFNNIISMLDDAKIVYGGKYDKNKLKIEPTFIYNPPMDHIIMKKEIFAPILPILVYGDKNDIYDIVEKNKNPLALYVFSRNKNFVKTMVYNIQSGTVCINDVVLQVSNCNIPFEGVGNSGMHGYHGKYSFDLFSHKRGILKAPFYVDIEARYPHKENLKFIKNISKILK